MAAPRAKLACASCTRRKVRCSKEIPCSNCIRRGEQDTCSPSPKPGVTSPAASYSIHAPAISPASTNDTELDYLRARVAELEAELKQRQPASPVGRDGGAVVEPTIAIRKANRASEEKEMDPRVSVVGTIPPASNSVSSGSGSLLQQQYKQQHPPPPPPTPSSRHPTQQHQHHHHHHHQQQQQQQHNHHHAPPPAYPTPDEETADPDAKHAASILEFLSWGRKKDPDYHDVSLEASEAIAHPSDVRDVDAGVNFPDMNQDWSKSQLHMIQALLPYPNQVWALERYHADALLWYHGSYHAPAFRRQLQGFYDRFDGSVLSPGVNLQWVAMLFAVLTGSMTAAPDALALSWGFRDNERGLLSRQWYRAVIKLLNLAEYTANQSILSTQAIATATISAHILGFSNMQSAHLAAANKIAYALGLHRLSDGCKGAPVEVEAGRRVWCQLTTQDWFSIPFSESYLISPLYSRSHLPLNCHDQELVSLPEDTPTVMTYCRFLQRIASIMPHLQDDMMHASTEYTKYLAVCKWDGRIRHMIEKEAPALLADDIPIHPEWPAYAPWARRALAISGNHKIIMVHRSFLSESFTNPAFGYTRKICLAASKTILNEYRMVVEEDGPILWVHQAFAVAASIILVLDILHRSPAEAEFLAHKRLVEETLAILCRCKNSMIALRGEKLLTALLTEVDRCVADTKKRKLGDDRQKQPRGMNVSAFVKRFCQGSGINSPEQGQAVLVPTPDSQTLTTTMAGGATFAAGQGAMLFGADLASQNAAAFTYPQMDGCFENLVWLANNDFATGML